MADILLNKLINDEIDVQLFLSWLSSEEIEDAKYEEIRAYCVEKSGFITYFLNFLHEDLPCNDYFGKTPMKVNTPKRLDISNTPEKAFGRRQSLFTAKNSDKNYDVNKSPSLPLNLNKTIDSDNLNVSLTSTPKVQNIINSSLETSYLSPISPLYKKENFNTPKGKKNDLPGKSPLCLGDFIVTKKIGKKKTPRTLNLDDSNENRTKRITPTTLCQKRVNNRVKETENSFNFQNVSEESEINRSFLAEERKKILTRKNNVELPIKKVTSSFMNLNIESEISLSLVTNNDKLVIFVDIYVLLLKKNWVLNVTSEIYFIVTLLLSKNVFIKENKCDSGNTSCENVGVEFLKDDKSEKLVNLDKKSKKKQFYNTEVFENVNNIVFFAVKCLENITELLGFYDKSTLKLLSENKRINKFAPDLKEKIQIIYKTKSDRILEIFQNYIQTNICFNLDTDNKENFLNINSFQSFRKQRDLFYEILRIWENNHMLQGWNFQISLSGKIKSLLALGSDPVNFVHFSRLFKQQLLTTCGSSQNEDSNEVSFLPSLPNLDAEKFSKLKSRLVTKQNSNGLNSLPVFSGHQEFYKEFIVTGSHHTFNKHLGDSLISEILELNSSKFDGIDPDQETDCTTKKSYLACLKSLRILAKFLGFLESIPYNTESQNYPENVLNLQIKVRCDVHPNFDVKRILKNSIIEQKVVLTVPWIVKYLAMLDYVTLRLPYFKELFIILFDLYKNYTGSTYNTSLIKITLGWLFELQNFPDTDFFNHIEKQDNTETIDNSKSKKVNLDSLDIVDQSVLYICCPYLSELKKLLTNNTSQSHVTVKHITPVTAVKSSNDIAKKKLELQLEEAFFNGQPMSTRKTVEFVSERVASTCVKHICNTIVPNYKKKSLEDLKIITEEWKAKTESLSEQERNLQKNTLIQQTNKLLQKNLDNLKKICLVEVTNTIKQKIPNSVENLLALDTLQPTYDTCISIATRTCLERVSHWINVHVTSAIFSKDFDGEVQKATSDNCCNNKKEDKDKPVFLLPPAGNNEKHDDLTFSAAQILEKMTILATSIIERTVTIDEEFILNVLKESLKTLTKRGDVNNCIKSYICTILVDISLLLVTHHTNLMTNRKILTNFALIWRTYHANPDNLFKNMISPRNIMLLAQSQNKVDSWDTMARFLTFLIKEKLMEYDTFEAQVTAIFRNNWDEETLKNLKTLIKTFLFCHKDSGGSVSQFTLLLEFLSEMCVDINNC